MLGREFVCVVGLAGLVASAGCASRAQSTPLPEPPPAAVPGAEVDAGVAEPKPAPARDVATMLVTGGTPAEWSCAPAGSSATLSATASDAGVLLETRLHAIEGLTWLPETDATDALRALANDPAADTALRSAATFALARRLGRTSVPELRPLLEGSDPNVRGAAVRGLGVVGGKEAQSALEAQLEREDSPELREAIQQSLTQMQP